MTCWRARRRLSAQLDGDLPARTAQALVRHLTACAACRRRWKALCEDQEALGTLPRVESAESIAESILDRLEVESRGPGLALLFRPWSDDRPLIWQSLLSASVVVVTILGLALHLDREAPLPRPAHATIGSWNTRLAAGAESRPFSPSADLRAPRIREQGSLLGGALNTLGGESAFFETVVASDGRVSAVTLLAGDASRAAPLLLALRSQRFEPALYRGRPVAASIYRLISHLEVRPLT